MTKSYRVTVGKDEQNTKKGKNLRKKKKTEKKNEKVRTIP
jgi:hypothetical protein